MVSDIINRYEANVAQRLEVAGYFCKLAYVDDIA
jgi:hypothetical protein